MYVCMRECVYVCMCVCVYVCVYVDVDVCVCVGVVAAQDEYAVWLFTFGMHRSSFLWHLV